ncbi:MAG TPA: alpha-L-fucosidase, partial [Sphingomicrobium sp.]
MRVGRRQFLVSGAAAACSAPIKTQAAEPFAATWESLARTYRVPEWFRDAKFGIWAHWGPQCQPEWGDWYARLMYVRGRQPWFPPETAYDHHLEHYGHPSRTGFIDIIGQWKAERWKPEYLLKRYAAAGARYVMAMGCHHDNLDLFASRNHG